MNANFVNKFIAIDACFHVALIIMIVGHPSYFKKELVGVDLVLHLLVLALLWRVVSS